jgi:hypothetical protein
MPDATQPPIVADHDRVSTHTPGTSAALWE